MTLVPFIILLVFVFRLSIAKNKIATQQMSKPLRKLRFRKAFNLLGNNFIDSRRLFVKLNKQLPNVMLINGIDVNEVAKFIEVKLNSDVKALYRHNQFDLLEQTALFNMIIVVTNDNKIIEIGNGYVELQYATDHTSWANLLAKDLSQFQIQTSTQVLTKNICITGFAGQMN